MYRQNTKNAATYANLATKAEDQPEKYREHNQRAQNIQVLSADFNAHLEKMKEDLLADIEDPTSYETMDGEDVGNNYFFEGDGFSQAGQQYVDKINNYRTKVNEILGDKYPAITENVNARF